MKDSLKIVGIVSVVLLLFGLVVTGYYGISYLTASIRGRVNAENQIESAPSRITSYNHFYDLCASIQSYEGALKAQKEQLKESTSEDDKSRIRANIAGLKGQRYRAIAKYNADAEKAYTIARFLGNKLPKHINPNQENISCGQ